MSTLPVDDRPAALLCLVIFAFFVKCVANYYDSRRNP